MLERPRYFARLFLVATAMTPFVAHAQVSLGGGQRESEVAAPGAEDPYSPRATMRQFLEASRQGDFTAAASLIQDIDKRAAGPEVAERIYRFIRRRVIVDLDSVSPEAEGNQSDGMPQVDHVGRMYVSRGRWEHPVELARVNEAGVRRWVVTAGTVAAVDSAYATIDASWTRGRLPASLLAPGPLGTPRWKWVLGLVGLPLAWLLTIAISFVLRSASLAVARRTSVTWDDELVVRLRGPARLFIASVLVAILPVALELDAATIGVWIHLLRAVSIVALFWAALRVVSITQAHLIRRVWAADRTSARTIIPLVGRSLRVGIGLVALLVAISQFGYPVATVLAGLGLGGLVVALAAQKTVENLFGSLSLAADRVFRIGDWVKVDDVQGTVERIGLRSTHLRTLDRTLVKFPNGKLAEARVESFGERDRIRFFMTLQLERATTAAQMRAVLADVEGVLRAHPRVYPDGLSVRFTDVKTQSLDVNVNAWLTTTDGSEFDLMRQELLLGILDAVERAGARLALPMQVMRMERESGAEIGTR